MLFVTISVCYGAVGYSVRHADIHVNNFVIDTGTFITVFNGTINLTENHNASLKSSLNANKLNNPTISTLELMYILNNVSVYEEVVISLSGTNNIKSIRTHPINIESVIGQNNITILAREKVNGVGAINVTSFTINIDSTELEPSLSRELQFNSTTVTFSNNTYEPLYTFTVPQGVVGGAMIDISSRINSSGATTVSCFLNSTIPSELLSTYYQRTLSSSTSIGSGGLFLHDINLWTNKNYTIFCKNTGAVTVTNNMTIYSYSNVANDTVTRIALEEFRNPLLNFTTDILYPAGINSVISITTTPSNNDTVNLHISTSMVTDSGKQNIKVYPLPLTPGVICNGGHTRTLEINNDAVIHFYTSCSNLTVLAVNSIDIVLEVDVGESVIMYDAVVEVIETSLIDVTVLPLLPIVSNTQTFTLLSNDFACINMSEEIRVYPQFSFSPFDIMNISFGGVDSYLMNLSGTDYFTINISNNLTQDINYSVLYINSQVRKNDTIKFRECFNIVIDFYKDTNYKYNQSSERWDNDIFNYAYLISNDDVSQNFINTMTDSPDKLFSWMPFYNTIPKLEITPLGTTSTINNNINYFSSYVENGVVNITLYDLDNYSLYLINMRLINDNPVSTFLKFDKPSFSNKEFESYITTFNIGSRENNNYNLYMDLFGLSKILFIKNLLFWLFILGVWVGLTFALLKTNPQMAIYFGVTYWTIVLTLKGLF